VSCAAYTRVDACEAAAELARRTNALDAEKVVGAAAVHVSTDYVFDGEGARPWTQADEPRRLSAYGRTKLEGQQRFLDAVGGGRGFVARTSWLHGPHGRCFPKTILELPAARHEVRVVEDPIGRPTCTRDLPGALLALARMTTTSPAAPGIYQFANARATSWHAFALAIRYRALTRGLPVKAAHVAAIPTTGYPTPARRPRSSLLSTQKIEHALGAVPRHWRDTLDEVLVEDIA